MSTTEIGPPPFHRDLRYLVISDIHLGHRHTKTAEIVAHLDEYFGHYRPDHPFGQLDAIFIAGDLFDSELALSEDHLGVIAGWGYRLLDFCVTHDIVLRILEGTPSHDHRQSRLFETIAHKYDHRLDFRYVEVLSFERIDKLGLDVLYVPDEWLGSAVKTQAAVQELMERHHIQQVDIAIMHGMFGFQVPVLGNSPLKHDEAFYLKIVRYFIAIGHIHVRVDYDRIRPPGSFDRISHGEEGPKGGLLFYLSATGDHEVVFVENKHAKIYKTVHIRQKDPLKAQQQFEAVLDKLPDNSHVRLKAKEGHPLLQGLMTFKARYPMLYLTKITEEDDKSSHEIIREVTVLEDHYTPFTLTKDNMVSSVMEEVTKNHVLPPDDVNELSQLLDSLLH